MSESFSWVDSIEEDIHEAMRVFADGDTSGTAAMLGVILDQIPHVRAQVAGLRDACSLVDVAHDHLEGCEECQDEGDCEVGANLWVDAMVAVRAALTAAPAPPVAPAPERGEEGG